MENKDLQLFNFKGHNVRMKIIDGEPYWVAKDVCEVLGFRKASDMVKTMEKDLLGRIVCAFINSLGRKVSRPFIAVNESGLYQLILKSRKPEAKAFQKWVTSEVLPAIRKSGVYSVALPPSVESGIKDSSNSTLQTPNSTLLIERYENLIKKYDDIINIYDNLTKAQDKLLRKKR